jgi:hypothetical protein
MPMPEAYRALEFFRPRPWPIFPDGSPTPEEVALARELFAGLDLASQEWYLSGGARWLFAGVKLARR